MCLCPLRDGECENYAVLKCHSGCMLELSFLQMEDELYYCNCVAIGHYTTIGFDQQLFQQSAELIRICKRKNHAVFFDLIYKQIPGV